MFRKLSISDNFLFFSLKLIPSSSGVFLDGMCVFYKKFIDMLLLSIKWNLLLLQMLEISKFNFAIKSLETSCVVRTLETNILLMPCILHLAAIFKIFCNKTSVPDVLFNKSFIPTWINAVSNWPSPSLGSI